MIYEYILISRLEINQDKFLHAVHNVFMYPGKISILNVSNNCITIIIITKISYYYWRLFRV